MDNIAKDSGPPPAPDKDSLINQEANMEEMCRESSGSDSENNSRNAAMDVDKKTEQGKQFSENLMLLEESHNCILQSFKHLGNQTNTDILDDTFAGNLIDNLDLARKNDLFSDITLLIGPEKHSIKAHRIVLSSASEYFRVMFTNNFKEGSQPEVDLPKTDVFTIEALMEFAYTGKVSVTHENIERITKAANFFGMTKLVEKCVGVITQGINEHNAVEILEFADHISNEGLKECAKMYFIKNLEKISKKNLDIMDMSPSLLLEIITNDAAAIDQDPTENEERLFQMGWNNLQSKSDEVWKEYVPKLLRAVHLPLVSESFLQDLSRKVEDHVEARELVEEAKLQKRTISDGTSKMTWRMDETLRWGMQRFHGIGKVSVTCNNMINGSNCSEWYSRPVFVQGVTFCLWARIETHTDIGPPEKCLGIYLCAPGSLRTKPIKCTFKMELISVATSTHGSYIRSEVTSIFDVKKKPAWGFRRFMTLPSIFANYYDKDTDSCTVIAHVSNVITDLRDEDLLS